MLLRRLACWRFAADCVSTISDEVNSDVIALNRPNNREDTTTTIPTDNHGRPFLLTAFISQKVFSSTTMLSRSLIAPTVASLLASQICGFSSTTTSLQSSTALKMSGGLIDAANFAVQQAPASTRFVTNKMCPFGT